MDKAIEILAYHLRKVALHHDKGNLVLHEDEYRGLQAQIESLKDLAGKVYRDDRLQRVEELGDVERGVLAHE